MYGITNGFPVNSPIDLLHVSEPNLLLEIEHELKVIIFLTVIWLTSKMSQRTEIIAMLASGISYGRILRPFLLAAIFLCGLSLILGHYVVPYANKKKFEFEVKYLKDQLTIQDINIHREIEPVLS